MAYDKKTAQKQDNIRDYVNDMEDRVDNAFEELLNFFYPVGTIYETTNVSLNTVAKMNAHFGGTWEEYGKGRVTVGLDSSQTEFNTVEKTGGAKTHKLILEELPKFKPEANPNVKQGGGWSTAQGSKYSIADGNGYILSDTPVIGNDKPHNNLQPYITVYRYRRTT